MNKQNKESWWLVGFIAQVFLYWSYLYFKKLNIAIFLFTYMSYIVFAMICYGIGKRNRLSKTRKDATKRTKGE